MTTKRVFVAIDLSDGAINAASSHIEHLKRRFPHVKARWIRPENLHVTLRFAGNIDAGELAGLQDRVARVAGTFDAPTVTVEKTGAFIRRKSRSNVLWLGISSHTDDGRAGVLEDLMARLDDEDRGPVHHRSPHLTIARLSDANAAQKMVDAHLAAAVGPVSFKVPEIVIYQSELTPRGSIYTAISRHQLLL